MLQVGARTSTPGILRSSTTSVHQWLPCTSTARGSQDLAAGGCTRNEERMVQCRQQWLLTELVSVHIISRAGGLCMDISL